MIQKISKITFLVFVLSIFQNSLLAIESGNDGVGSIIPKTSIAKPPTKLTAYKSAKKKIIKAKKYDKKGKDNKAIKLYEEALNYLYEANRIKPFDPDILSYLGLVNAKIGNLDDAEIYYLLGLENEAKKYANLLGYNYQSSKWYEKTFILFNKNYKIIEVKKEKNSILDRFKSLFE